MSADSSLLRMEDKMIGYCSKVASYKWRFGHLWINKTAFIVLLAIQLTEANAWPLLGPSSYEECVLEAMRGVQSDAAAAIINRTCLEKFPKAKEKKPKRIPSECRVNIWDGEPAAKMLEKVEHGGFLGSLLSITNKNSISLSGIYLGVLKDKKGKSCSTSYKDYSQFYSCKGTVSGWMTGYFSCIPAPQQAWCVVGLATGIQDDCLDFYIREGFDVSKGVSE